MTEELDQGGEEVADVEGREPWVAETGQADGSAQWRDGFILPVHTAAQRQRERRGTTCSTQTSAKWVEEDGTKSGDSSLNPWCDPTVHSTLTDVGRRAPQRSAAELSTVENRQYTE